MRSGEFDKNKETVHRERLNCNFEEARSIRIFLHLSSIVRSIDWVWKSPFIIFYYIQ